MSEQWSTLWSLVREMGAREVRDLDISLPTPESVKFSEGLSRGVEISLSNLDPSSETGGLISVDGMQALVYIPDQGGSLDSVLRNPEKGKKFHISHCSTLISMASKNMNHRYVATNDTSGIFNLTDSAGSRRERGKLSVCRNCLKFMNFNNYRLEYEQRNSIYKSFDLSEFFSTYSSLFRNSYREADSDLLEFSKGARPSSHIESNPKDCQQCGVSLPVNSGLVQSNGEAAGKDICLDCLRREPDPIFGPVSRSQMKEISQARRAQGLMSEELTWDEAFKLADPAFHGIMRIYKCQGRAVPEPGVPLVDAHGVVLDVELALAWETSGFAVVATSAEKKTAIEHGWNALHLKEALIDSREDG